MRRIYLVPVLLAFVLGCASASTVPGPSSRSFVSSRNLVTGDEIRAHEASNALAAIESLRPWFLGNGRSLSEAPAVYVDGIRLRNLMALTAIGPEEIREIRYMRAVEALVPFGGPASAIMVTTHRYPGHTEQTKPHEI